MPSNTFIFNDLTYSALESYKDLIIAQSDARVFCVVDLVKGTVFKVALYDENLSETMPDKHSNNLPAAQAFIDLCKEREENMMNSYLLLGRYRTDLEYYFGAGNKHAGHLFFDSIDEHMTETRKMFESFPDPIKPLWITDLDIKEYEVQVSNAHAN
jgi:hypothetical protein